MSACHFATIMTTVLGHTGTVYTTAHKHNDDTSGAWAAFLVVMFLLLLVCLSLSWYPSVYMYTDGRSSSSSSSGTPVEKERAHADYSSPPDAPITLTL